MLAWVYEAARACPQLDSVVIATDSEEIVEVCNANGWPVELTSADLPSGTDRVHAVSRLIDADIYVNIQGDEPLLKPEHLSALLRPFSRGSHVEVSTLRVACAPINIHNPNAVKVVTAADGRALFFSRSTIPYNRDGGPAQYWKHIGLYGYRKSALERFPTLHSFLEHTERLEQLRFLENGISVYVETTEFDTIGVDTEEDLRHVESILLKR